ncbi:MAG: hypothetical protein ACQESE_03980 [Nanobdellota archaeon]
MNKKLITMNQPHPMMLEKDKILGEHINDRSDMYKLVNVDGMGRRYAVDSDLASNITLGIAETIPVAYMILGTEGKHYSVKAVTSKTILKSISDKLKHDFIEDTITEIEGREQDKEHIPNMIINHSNDFYTEVKVGKQEYIIESESKNYLLKEPDTDFVAYKVMSKNEMSCQVKPVTNETIKNTIVKQIYNNNNTISVDANEFEKGIENPELDLEQQIHTSYFNGRFN